MSTYPADAYPRRVVGRISISRYGGYVNGRWIGGGRFYTAMTREGRRLRMARKRRRGWA